MIADCFSKHSRNLYYYHKESGLEIDFITTYEDKAVLVEAKATNGNTKSAITVLKNRAQYGVDLCIKCGESNIGFDDSKLTIPAYMTFLLF